MADINRKLLINLHSAEQKMPVGRLNLGEIAVQHSGVDTAKLYVETDTTNPSSGTIATFITERAIDLKISDVNERINATLNALNSLLNITITGGTGDDVIKVETDDPNASANTLTIRHYSGYTASELGFKKIASDKYGHVTGYELVEIGDVSGLTGFDDAVNEVVDKTNTINVGATDNKLVTSKAVSDYVTSQLIGAVTYKGVVNALPQSGSVGDLYIAASEFTISANDSATGEAQNVEVGDYIILRTVEGGNKWDSFEKNEDGVLTEADVISSIIIFSGITSGDTRLVSAGVLKKVIFDNEKVTAQALNELNETIVALSGAVIGDSSELENKLAELSASTVEIESDLTILSAATVANEKVTASSLNNLNDNINDLSGAVVELSASTIVIENNINDLSGVTVELESGLTYLSATTIANEKVTAQALNELNDRINNLSASTITQYVSNVTQTNHPWSVDTSVTEYTETVLTLNNNGNTSSITITEYDIIDCGTY